MSFRTIYGKSVSAEGWRMCNADECTWVKVPGANVTIQIRSGIPATILGAFVARFNQVVEPVRDADTACWTATNSVATSNHLSAVAVDIDWDSHPFHVRGTFGDRLPKVRQVLAEFRDCVWWGGDWTDPIDEMHFELNFPEGHWAGRPEASEFIVDVDQRLIDLANDLKTGYLGIYVPGAPPPPPPPPASNAVDVLARATGITQAKAQEILVGVVNGLRDSQCTNVNRVAMWLAQIGHESAGFNATEEYQSGDESTDRWRYKGRTWIQITWQSNYAGLSQWAFGKGLIPTATYFVDNPKKLAEIQYAGLGPAWYWTVARPQINSLCDARNLTAVTQAINGGQNGAADRKTRYDRASALGDQLLALTTDAPPPQGEGFLMALSDSEQREVLDYLRWLAAPGTGEFRKKFASRSAVREPNEGPVDSITGMELNTDGNVDFLATYLRAQLKYTPAVDRLKRVAAGLEPERPGLDALLAQAMLAESSKKPAVVVTAATAPAAPAVVNNTAPADTRELADAYAEIARLREENARLQAVVSTPPPPIEPTPLPAVVEQPLPAMTSGDHAGKVIDSVEDWTEHILSMDTKQRAAFVTSIKALELPNGSQS